VPGEKSLQKWGIFSCKKHINRPITRYDIRKVYEVIQNIQPELELYDEAQHLMVYLKKLNALLNDLDYTSPFLPAFEPGFKLSDELKRFFENAYLENDVEILEHIASLVRKGGVLRTEKVKIKLEAQAITIDYVDFTKLKGLKTIIFDGTAKYDVEYKDEQFAILELPDIRSYNNLTIYNCPINMSRTNVLSKRSSERFDFQELFGDLESINGKEVLVLTYEKLINTVKKGMENTKFCENNRVYLDHYNNIKGKNIYANCTVLLNIGINYKGHAYYIAKSISLGEDFSDINEGEDKIRMLNKKIMPIIESDLFTEIIQNFFRTALRKSSDERIEVYSFITNSRLLNLLKEYFVNATVETWYPEEFYKHYLMCGTEHDQRLLKLSSFLKTSFSSKLVVTKKEIRETLGYIDQDTLANHLKTDYIKYILRKLNIKEKYHSLQKDIC